MPIYGFKCPDCSSSRDVVCSVAERDGLRSCQSCGAPMQRMPGASAMNFRTLGGNTYRWTLPGETHNNYKKPKSIGRGHGVGGRRKNPTIQRHPGGVVSWDRYK